MKVNGTCLIISFIDKTNDGLGAKGHMERWAWRNSIIANKFGGLEFWVNLLSEVFDANFIVLDFGSIGFGVCSPIC